jgi:hypothetical protein
VTLAYDIRADCSEFCSPASQSGLLHLELDDSGAAPGKAMAPGVLSLFRVSFGSGKVATGNSTEVGRLGRPRDADDLRDGPGADHGHPRRLCRAGGIGRRR